MARTPRAVYLDTSDISRFAAARKGRADEGLAEIYSRLIKLKSDGQAFFPYSFIHLAEMVKSGDAETAYAKAVVLEELCGDYCFLPVGDIFEFEVRSLLAGRGLPHATRADGLLSRSGQWLRKRPYSLPDLDGMLRSELRRTRLPRYRRRSLGSSLKRQGLLATVPQEAREHIIRTADERYAFRHTDALLRIVDALLRGEIKRSKAEAAFTRLAMKLSQVALFSFAHDNLKGKLPGIVEQFGQAVVRAVDDMRKRLQGVSDEMLSQVERHLPEGVARRAALKIFTREGVILIKSVPAGTDRLQELVIEAEAGVFPSIDLLSCLYRQYAIQHTKDRKTPRPPRVADAGDFMHAAYLPYVDVFRADRYMAELLRQCRARCGGATIVNRLELLPAAIVEDLSTG